MAEQVRYKRSNMALRVPTVSFEGAKAQARGFQGIARSLDSMSNYFFQMAEQKAQIEGAEYGATNAPTQQQIEDAYQRGEEIELPGDQSSVYGRAVRRLPQMKYLHWLTLALQKLAASSTLSLPHPICQRKQRTPICNSLVFKTLARSLSALS